MCVCVFKWQRFIDESKEAVESMGWQAIFDKYPPYAIPPQTKNSRKSSSWDPDTLGFNYVYIAHIYA